MRCHAFASPYTCFAILLSESPLFTVYVFPAEISGAVVDEPDVTSEKSAFGAGGVDELLLVVSEKSGEMPDFFGVPLSGLSPKMGESLSKIPMLPPV